jgi:hypothetical protein
MAAYLSTFKILLLVSVLFNCIACSSHAKKNEYSAITAAPLFEVTLQVPLPVAQGNGFFNIFRRYAESNNLVAFDLEDAPITFGDRREDSTLQINDSEYATLNSPVAIDLDDKPTTEDIRQGSIFQINDKRGYPLFVFDNFTFKNVFELAAYPSDIPLAQQHVYNLVQTLTATFQGRIKLKSCNKVVLDCDRLIALLQPSCITCSLQMMEKASPVVTTMLPIFTMKWIAPVGQRKHFADTIHTFAKSNNFTGDSLNSYSEIRGNSMYRINTEQGDALFIFNNLFHPDEFSLFAYPSDIPLAQQHIYNLVKTLTTNFQGRTELILCEAKVLDCDKLKSLLQVK